MSALKAWEELRVAAMPLGEDRDDFTEDLYELLKERDPAEAEKCVGGLEEHRTQVLALRSAIEVMGNYMASPAWDTLGDLAAAVGMPSAPPGQVLAEVLRWKGELAQLRKDICHEVAARENDRIRAMLTEEERDASQKGLDFVMRTLAEALAETNEAPEIHADKLAEQAAKWIKRAAALLAPVDVEAEIERRVEAEALRHPFNSPWREENGRQWLAKEIRPLVEREAMLTREVSDLHQKLTESIARAEAANPLERLELQMSDVLDRLARLEAAKSARSAANCTSPDPPFVGVSVNESGKDDHGNDFGTLEQS